MSQVNVGEYLKAERERKNISFEDISAKTRIKKEFIKAIEYEEFCLLPPEPFAGGFIKNSIPACTVLRLF